MERMKLTNQERETIINYNMAENTACIHTANPREWRRFESLGIKPTETYTDSDGTIYAKDYGVPKRWVKLPRPPRQMSEKQRVVAMRNLREIHQR